MTEKNITRAQLAVFALAGMHLAALAVLLAGGAANQVAPHVVLAVLLPIRALKLRGGRPRTRIVLTVVLGIQVLAHAALPSMVAAAPQQAAWLIAISAVSLVLEAAALTFLWLPGRRQQVALGR